MKAAVVHLPPAGEDAALGRIRVDLNELVALRMQVAHGRRARTAPRFAPQAGNVPSRARGRGMDYFESRIYQPGDDVRHLDWRLTARSGHLHTKLFEEEREHSLLLLLDCNASMYFGTRRRFKSVQAARLAAVAAWAAVQSQERVGVAEVGGHRDTQRATGGQRGALAICGALARWDARARAMQAETLGEALQRLRPTLRRAGRVLVISDGLSCEEGVQARLSGLCRHHRFALLTVADALELESPPPGRYPLAHDGRRERVDLSDAAGRRAFREALGAGPERMRVLAAALRIPLATVDTRDDSCDAVQALLGRAASRSPQIRNP